MFKYIGMSPSSKFWWFLFALVVIILVVVIHWVIIWAGLLIVCLLMPSYMSERIEHKFDLLFMRFIVRPIKSFNSWLDSKFDK